MLKINHSFKNLESIKFDSVSVSDVNRCVGMPVVKQINRNGRVSTEVVFEETPVEKLHEGLTVDDFALENLLANGYQPHLLIVDNQTLDTIDKGVENIAKAVSAVNSAKSEVVSSQNVNSEVVSSQNIEPKNV